ncbi:unnamed protein product [Mycena citricolor]|uniref:F-box domain-containing protein n=1 Tax=Mycena citricolor TaxID=2018698 RepID=A0AAD2HVH2_9AGAR|nr:unnamed protein product [Mycena citricolor]
MSSPASSAPPEIIDLILDFLHADHRTLFSASLVARKWVPSARFHAFHRIALHHLPHPRQSLLVDNVQEFIDICASPLCTIVPAVHEVLLDIQVHFNFTPNLLRDVVDALHQAPVRKLVFVDHTPAVLRKPFKIGWIALKFPALNELVYHALDQVAEDLLQLAVDLPELRALSIYSSSKEPAASALTRMKPFPVLETGTFAKLRTLRYRLYAKEGEEFLGWLGSLPSLETLDVWVFQAKHTGWGPVDNLNNFLAHDGAHIQNMTLAMVYEDHAPILSADWLFQPSGGTLDLSPLTNLCTLKLESHDAMSLCTTLASLPAGPRQTIITSFPRWPHRTDFSCPCDFATNLSVFSTTMIMPQFQRLARFDILVPAVFADEGREMLAQFFPRQMTQGVLRVWYCDGEEGQEGKWPPDSWEELCRVTFGVVQESPAD